MTELSWESIVGIAMKMAKLPTSAKQGYIKVGYKCNNNCIFCTAEWKKKNGDRETAAIIEIIEQFKGDPSICQLVLSGGEPTIRKDLLDIIAHARENGMNGVILQTNARMLKDREYVKELKNAGLTSCFVSIHGHNSEIHDSLVRAEGAFCETMQGMENLQEEGVAFSTNTVVCRSNYQSLDEILKLLLTYLKSARKAKFSYPNIQGGAADNVDSMVVPLDEVSDFFINAIEYGKSKGLTVDTEFMPFCLLKEHYSCGSELLETNFYLSDVTFSVPNANNEFLTSGKIFYDECSSCCFRSKCPGIHPMHEKSFGKIQKIKPFNTGD